jgi:ABC-type transport system involved in cytochrome c biogenesis ATPase subunit
MALDTVADWPCRWLSAGQRRRVALARLLGQKWDLSRSLITLCTELI